MEQDKTAPASTPAPYEPPQVERVLTADDLVREVQYAGAASADEAVDGGA